MEQENIFQKHWKSVKAPSFLLDDAYNTKDIFRIQYKNKPLQGKQGMAPSPLPQNGCPPTSCLLVWLCG